MADKRSSELIPEGWRFEIKQRRNGSQVSSYFCPKTGQRFYTYEDMMRYVNYAKKVGLPVYIPEFDFRNKKKKKLGQSSESSDKQIEKNLEAEKVTDTEKSLDLSTDTESLDSEKTTDIGDFDFPENDPSEKVSAIEMDILTSEDQVNVERAPMQASTDGPGVENPDPVIQDQDQDPALGHGSITTVLPKSSRNWPRKHPRPRRFY